MCNGGIGTNTSIAVNDLTLRSPSFEIDDNTFLTPVDYPYVESIDVTNTTIQIRKLYTDITVFQRRLFIEYTLTYRFSYRF